MSVLSLIKDLCRLNALTTPTVILGSTDTTVQQLYGVLRELIGEISSEANFNVNTVEAVFTSTATEDQGALATLAPFGFKAILLETVFDRTQRRALYGPLTESEWQAIKALPNPGPYYKFRIKGDRFLLNPIPVAPFSVIAFEYASNWLVTSATGTLQSDILTDADLFLLPEPILLRGAMARWKQLKGLPYQADEEKYYSLLNAYIARDKVKARINLAQPNPNTIQPGIFVPSGNWFN